MKVAYNKNDTYESSIRVDVERGVGQVELMVTHGGVGAVVYLNPMEAEEIANALSGAAQHARVNHH